MYRTLPIDPATMTQLLEMASQPASDCGGMGELHRRHPRFKMRGLKASCTITPAGGMGEPTVGYLVDVSQNGVSLFYPCYLHQGMDAEIIIPTKQSGELMVRGQVSWCVHLMGMHHYAGVSCDEPIEIRSIVEEREWIEYTRTSVAAQAPLQGRACVYSREVIARDALRIELANTELELLDAASSGELLDHVGRDVADMVILDIDAHHAQDIDLLGECRRKHFLGPIVLISSDPEAPHALQLDPLSRSRCVAKPLHHGSVESSLRDVISEHPTCITDSACVYPEIDLTPELSERIESFIQHCHDLDERIRRSIASGNYEAAAPMIEIIATWACRFGFGALGREASLALSHLQNQNVASDAVAAHTRSVSRIISRMRLPEGGQQGQAA